MKNNVSFNSTLTKFGMGLFETIKVTDYPLDLDLHMNRLFNSIKELNLSINLEGIEMKYSYLMESRKYNNETVYGIVVKKESIKNKVVVSTIEDRVDIISKKKEVVQKLLDLLYRNQVSPIHLIDVIGETVDNCVLEFN